MGVAPLLYLARYLNRKGVQVKIYFGAKTISETINLEALGLEGCDIQYATEDGSKGFNGLVTESLKTFLTVGSAADFVNASIFCCGPFKMAAAVSEIALAVDLPCQVSMEEKMACGVGACLGCVTATRTGGYKRVCVEGPVFDSAEIDWNKLSC